jgi:hypothetical protein
MCRLGSFNPARFTVKPPVETRGVVTTVSDVLRGKSIDRVDFLEIDLNGAELDVARYLSGRLAEDPTDLARVHDIDDRVRIIHELLEGAGFDDVQVSRIGRSWAWTSTCARRAMRRRSPGSTVTRTVTPSYEPRGPLAECGARRKQ